MSFLSIEIIERLFDDVIIVYEVFMRGVNLLGRRSCCIELIKVFRL